MGDTRSRQNNVLGTIHTTLPKIRFTDQPAALSLKYLTLSFGPKPSFSLETRFIRLSGCALHSPRTLLTLPYLPFTLVPQHLSVLSYPTARSLFSHAECLYSRQGAQGAVALPLDIWYAGDKLGMRGSGLRALGIRGLGVRALGMRASRMR